MHRRALNTSVDPAHIITPKVPDMTEILIISILIGMVHALEADHLAAVSSFAVQKKSGRAILRQGFSWGVGHTVTLFLIVVPLYGLGRQISPQVSAGMEGFVGLLLVGLAARLLYSVWRGRLHIHVHPHDDSVRLDHIHSHENDASYDHKHFQIARGPLAIGLVHGMAGAAALLILVQDSVTTLAGSVLMVLLFGIGSIFGMSLVAQTIALPLRATWARPQLILSTVQFGAATFAIYVGVTAIHEAIAVGLLL